MTVMKTSLKAKLIATAIAALPIALPSGAEAAGLGAINVFSALGQPLRAEIELKASAEELQSLSARIAPVEAFRQANVGYSPLMTGLQFNVEMRGSRPVVKVTSARPVREPFLEMLVELQWANGRLLREYTFLLDPAEAIAPAPAVAAASQPRAAAAPAQSAVPARPAAAVSEYRVKRGDTLRSIANAHRVPGANLDQMLIALLRQNPDAFDDGNINRLRAGAILSLPDQAAVQSIDAPQARREIVAQAADFEAYRNRLAGAVTARPAAQEQKATRESSGEIAPRVAEAPSAERGQDRVEVSGVPGDASDPTRLARLQALEEELVAREQSLEEANSRLSELEQSIRDLQRLIELRNESLAQLQQQLGGNAGAPEAVAGAAADGAADVPTAVAQPADAPELAGEAVVAEAPAEIGVPAATEAADPTPETNVRPAEQTVEQAAAPSATAQTAAPTEPAAAVPDVPAERPAPAAPAPIEEATFLQSLLDDPRLLGAGGGILALLLGFAGYRVRQRRNESAADETAVQLSEYPSEAKSVFGGNGGQSVDTGSASSVLHTDFSQSGLSAIDADEGVDPVAEADVYMAYGRDAQAEEILLDALKSDPSRTAIYLKLLEIYAQRNSAKQFESVATDLYSRTGGKGDDWAKAAEMGRKLDPDNPLYGGKVDGGEAAARRDTAPTAALGVAAAGAAGAAALTIAVPGDDDHGIDEVTVDALEDLDFTLPSEPEASPTQLKDTWAMPGGSERLFDPDGDEAVAPAPDPAVDEGTPTETAARLPDVDFSVLDFDLDSGADAGTAESADRADSPEAEIADAGEVDAASTEDLTFELDIGDDHAAAQQGAGERTGEDERLEETLVGDALNFGASTEEFDLPEVADEVPAAATDDDFGLEWSLDEQPAASDADLSATVVQTEDEPAEDDAAVTDLERTEFDNQLLDFDFDLDGTADAASSDAPMLDLSDIDLELESPADDGETSSSTASGGDVSPADEALSPEALQEVDTKLDLARAYEEMGDKEGARELIDEVLREGSANQREAANRLLERLD